MYAIRLLPEVNAPIVMAFSAIETLIGAALPVLPRTRRLPPGLWDWIARRGNNFLRRPSVDEELDELLRALAGSSLKSDPGLWRSFLELRKARNSLAHSGLAVTLDGQEVTPAVATDLVLKAREITDWIEARLPSTYRRAQAPSGPIAHVTATLAGPL